MTDTPPIMLRLDRWKPKPGRDGDFYQYQRLHAAADTPKLREAARELQREVSVSAYETIGCPVVGKDATADMWLASTVAASMALSLSQAEAGEVGLPQDVRAQGLMGLLTYGAPYHRLQAAHRGMPVLALATDHRGFDPCLPWPSLDLLVPGATQAQLPPETVATLLQPRPARAMADFAQTLDGISVPWATAASAWCRFWGSQGFGYHAHQADPSIWRSLKSTRS